MNSIVIAGLIAQMGAITIVWLQNRGTQKKVASTDDQVTNGHGTNLRDDISAVLTRLSIIELRLSRVEHYTPPEVT